MMIPIKVQLDFWQLAVFLLGGGTIALIAGVSLLVGLKVGENRGYRKAPEKYKDEWREEHHKRLVAEELLSAAEEVRRHDKVTIGQLAAARYGETGALQLVEKRVAGR